MKSSTAHFRSSIYLSIGVALVLGACTAAPPAAPFPELKQKVDSSIHSLGNGACETKRTGVWLANGGVVVEIQKPKGVCTFVDLNLVIGGESIPYTTLDDSFYCRADGYSGAVKRCAWYRGDSGKIFFRTSREIDPGKIRGIAEPSCRSLECLNETAALN